MLNCNSRTEWDGNGNLQNLNTNSIGLFRLACLDGKIIRRWKGSIINPQAKLLLAVTEQAQGQFFPAEVLQAVGRILSSLSGPVLLYE